jgi:hypothetical protein
MDIGDLALGTARNNAAWCDLVCGTHGAAGEFEDAVWFTRGAVPPFYPNLITLTPDGVDVELARVDELVGAFGSERTVAVKDSFARLDLSSRGFTPIIEAEWYVLSTAPVETSSVQIEFVSGDDELVDWERAWSATSPSETRVFKPELLHRDDVSFLAAREGGEIVAGVIANRAAGVVGISNVFVRPRIARDFLVGALGAVCARYGGLPLVGYSGGAELAFMLSLGFECVGPLRVWRRAAG